jgi:hypothetical protein
MDISIKKIKLGITVFNRIPTIEHPLSLHAGK